MLRFSDHGRGVGRCDDAGPASNSVGLDANESGGTVVGTAQVDFDSVRERERDGPHHGCSSLTDIRLRWCFNTDRGVEGEESERE